MVTPASAIPPISPIQTRFMVPVTHSPTTPGEAREQEMGGDDDDTKTEIGSPKTELADESHVTLPPIRTLPPPIVTRDYIQPTISRDALQTSAVPRGISLYGPIGVTPAPAELARALPQDKTPILATQIPGRQPTFFGIQNMPVADGSGRFATMCAPPTPSSPRRPGACTPGPGSRH
ncbi:hypothetical protein RhiJN_01918 [Ceratobasidium sp. AG-Ba]|nr:hypothetical protein RhiJN_01918 [Ceratobasidium sp. AG-Ba]